MRLFLLCLLVMLSCSLSAAEDYYRFDTAAQEQRFTTLTSQLRCLVCQNQNLAESNAPLAADLRNQVYQQIQQGKSNNDIVSYLVARYGDFILYQPPLNEHTFLLWFGPVLLLLLGVGYLLYYIGKKRHHREEGQ